MLTFNSFIDITLRNIAAAAYIICLAFAVIYICVKLAERKSQNDK